MNMAVATNPGTLLGFGTWVAYATGQVLVGFEASGTFDALDESLGAETAAHTLTTDEIPAHTHSYDRQNPTTDSLSIHDTTRTTGGNSSATSGSAGGGSAHSHSTLQPSVTVHMWKRTA
jgi:microcystin-dependent protein